MLLFRNFLFVLSAFFISGCGLRPLYAPSPSHKNSLFFSHIYISPIPDRKGQILRNNLRFLLAPNGNPEASSYRFEITLSEVSKGLGILKDATFSRSQITYNASFILRDIKSLEALYSSSTSVTSNYNVIVSNEFATLVSAEEVEKRSLSLLAEQITRDLATYFFLK